MNINRKQFTVGFLAITIVAIALYIILESPLFLRSRVAGIKIGSGWTDYFYLTSNQFACTTDGNAAHTDCALSLEGNPLEISVSYTPGDSLLGCTATYADKPVPCRPSHSIFNTTKLGVYIDDDLGISPMRMAQIRSEHPLLYRYEATWLTLTNGLVVAVTILILVAFWIRRPQKPSAHILTSLLKSGAILVLSGLIWYASLWGLIILGYVD